MARIALPLTPGAQGPLRRRGGSHGARVGRRRVRAAAAAGRPDASLMGDFGQALLGVTTALDGFSTLPTAPTRDLAFGTQVLVRLGGARRDRGAAALADRLHARRARACAAPPHRRRALDRLDAVVRRAVPARGPVRRVPRRERPASGHAGGCGDAGAAAGLRRGRPRRLSASACCSCWCGCCELPCSPAPAAAKRPDPVGAVAALLIVTTVTATLLWLENPYSATLLILPAHLWLVVLTRERERSPALGALCVVISLAPLAAVLALICSVLHVEPFALLWTTVLLIAGGGSRPAAWCWRAWPPARSSRPPHCCCAVRRSAPTSACEVTVRGPLSYAGPGSLGGTESALRR